MATIEDNINRKRMEEEGHIRKSLASTWEEIKNEIIKGKRAQVGEVREWGGIKMRKEANGWVPVREGGQKPKAEGEQGESQPVSLEDHAKNASEQALVNATKMSNDPKVREAAHKELMRRKNEEAQETFKAPEGEEKEIEEKHPGTHQKKETKPIEKEENKGDVLEGVDKEVLNKFRSLSTERQSKVLSNIISEVQDSVSKEAVVDVIDDLLKGLTKEQRKRVLENAIKG